MTFNNSQKGGGASVASARQKLAETEESLSEAQKEIITLQAEVDRLKTAQQEQAKLTHEELLQQARKQDDMERIKPIKRGLYYVEALSGEESRLVPDPFLVASKLAKDSVLAYHAALELHGAAYSHAHRVYFYSKTQTRRFEFMDTEYVPVQKKVTWGVTTLEREGNTVRLTDRERTVLDCLDRPDYAGGLEELFKSLDLFPSVDLEKLKTYLRKAGKVILYSKAGFLLEHFKDRWNVSVAFLNELAKKVEGKENRYFCTKKGNGKLVNRWNLIVPENFNSLLQAA